MNANYVNQMFELGGTIVVLGMPAGTEFGIDLESWNLGSKFKGIKMIPPGLHFIYFSSVNKYGETSPRTGFFHYFEQKEVIVKNYSALEEDIYDEDDLEKVNRIKLNLKDIDQGLGPYPFRSWTKWISFTQHIDKINLKRLEPISGKICSAPNLINKDNFSKGNSEVAGSNCDKNVCESDAESSSSAKDSVGGGGGVCSPLVEGSLSAERDKPKLPNLMPLPGTEIRFSTFPEKPHREGASPSEVSRGNIDSSYTMNFLFKQLDRPESILSEIQFSFICFVVGQSWDSFEHWRKLIMTMCKAEETLLQHPSLYSAFLSMLHHQIQELPEDLFADIVESSNFLLVCLRTVFANIFDNVSSLPVSLASKAERFRVHLSSKFKWNFALEEEDDDKPVIVEI